MGVAAHIGISLEPLIELSGQTPAVDSTSAPSKIDECAQFTSFAAQNLFNFAAGFAQEIPGSSEAYVPLSAIQRWYQTIQRKLSLDPNFWKR